MVLFGLSWLVSVNVATTAGRASTIQDRARVREIIQTRCGSTFALYTLVMY
jgi:hypothetical protein